MLIILGFSLVILLPVFAYLLHPLSSHKSHVFLITLFLFGGFAFNFVSNKQIFGSWKLSYQSDSMREIIDKNVEFPNKVTTELIFSQHSHEDSFLIGTEIFYQSLDNNSLVSAESIFQSSWVIALQSLGCPVNPQLYPYVCIHDATSI